MESKLPDSIVNSFLKGNDQRFFDEKEFDKTHEEKFKNISEVIKKQVEDTLKNLNSARNIAKSFTTEEKNNEDDKEKNEEEQKLREKQQITDTVLKN